MISYIFCCLSKKALFISLKKSFSKSVFASVINSVFISIYSFIHAFLLNWIISALFKILTDELMLILAILCEQHSFFIMQIACKLITIFILADNNGKSLRKSYKSLGYSKSTSRIYPLLYIHISFTLSWFFKKPSLNFIYFFSI